tara:strand:- start:3925 stop:4047 length:123 start_codon:yes stop_codon:yes gene_type:complete
MKGKKTLVLILSFLFLIGFMKQDLIYQTLHLAKIWQGMSF